ncbi:aminopeptidase N-like isoform X2 [Microplitis mediator]|uniref:aminopeptidase N-like isoform X2 n=1 Tax=Microplitis mediator TaxID=375433 RepID=UPI00255777B9|nr:aminopeptidase N-like isoform X2 [Microplitis mediator]
MEYFIGLSKLLSTIIVWVICVKYCYSHENNTIRFHRLPKNVIPISYDLQLLLPYFSNNYTYHGRVIIDISVIEQTNSIILNYDGLDIESEKTEFLTYEIDNLTILSQSFDSDKQFFTILFNQKLKIGIYKLYLYFNGHIRDDLFGFYRSKYKAGNETRWMAVTQFSQTFARRAFPCFDEPYMKATFKLHFGHYRNQTITSNTIPDKITPTNSSNYIITSMKKTPKMSTYLVGWSIHDFNYQQLVNSTNFSLWTRKTMTGKGSLALKEGRLIYSTLESYLSIENPINKIDHIAISDFHFSAMENWGMITFRESAILFDKKTTPTNVIHAGLNTMGHEYAHTWFGNLVTPEFWNVVWLKEAHNRTMNGKDNGEADTIMGYADFNAYQKGSSIVRMINHLMGSTAFTEAIKSFLKANLYGYVTPEVLYEHLQNYTMTQGKLIENFNIREVIETYANQPGYPLISIKRNYSSGLVEISQERFDLNSNWTSTKPPQWWVPLSFASKSQTNSAISSTFGSIWLAPKDKDIIKIDSNPQDWIICDIDKVGYYRVNYDSRNWHMLIEHLRTDEFHTIKPISRATLIDDAFNLAEGGYIPYDIFFNLINYLSKETEYEPWFTSLKSFNFLNQIFKDLPVLRTSIQSYVRRLLKTIYESFSFDEVEDQLRIKLLRSLILSTACEMNYPDCLQNSILNFNKWINNSSWIVEPDLKSFVYCNGIRFGSAKDWEKVFSRFIEADLHTEKELLMKGLGCTNNVTLINKFLNYATSIDGLELPKQYQTTIIKAILSGNRKNVNYTLEFMSKNLEKIIKVRGKEFLVDILISIKYEITSAENLKKFSSLVENNIDSLGNHIEKARNAVKYAEKSIAWIEKYSPVIERIVN